jgi:hypothetical protein
MFEDIIDEIDALVETARIRWLSGRDYFASIAARAEEALSEELISSATDAMDSISEYSSDHAESLREHLLENLQTRSNDGFVHVKVYDNGDVFIFDEDFAGTAEDFEAAKHESRNTDKNLKYRFWKYGIYMPDVEGGSVESTQEWFKKAAEKLPSYDEIISERLSIWGEKAPYWYFIENGTAGGAKAYPSFPGTHFISKLRSTATSDVRQLYNEAIRHYAEEAAQALHDSLETGREISREDDLVKWNEITTRTGKKIWRARSAETGTFLPGVLYGNPNE